MNTAFTVVGVFGVAALVLYWFIRGLIRDKDKLRDEMDEQYNDALRKNREADNARAGSDLDKRVREKYSSKR